MTARLSRRLPRRTVRLRLTLLYGVLFLLSGTGLLVITYVLVAHRFPTLMTAGSQHAGQAPGNVTFSGLSTACNTAQLPPAQPSQVTLCMQEAQSAIAKQRAAEMNQLLTQSGVALAIMSVFSIALGWLVAGRVLRPLRTITATARRLSANNLNQRLALAGPDDELKELSDTFDGLLARLEASFAAQRQFVANASHELRTPLARQRTVMEVALADPQRSAGSLSQACTQVLAAGEQQERLIEALLTLARSQRGLDRREPVELAAVVAGALRSRLPEAGRRGITVDAGLGQGIVQGDARLAERLVANLVDNAVAHNVPGGWVRIKSGSRPGYAFLAIANSGPVIADGEVDRLFEPFQRLAGSRVSRDGLGLGLSIVRAIAAAHHAQLRARPQPTGGLDIQLRFPRQPGGMPVAAPPPPVVRPASPPACGAGAAPPVR
jgi:signal transduction histidine kinase